MRALVFASALFFAGSAFAANNAIPSTLTCFSNGKSSAVKSFSITGLDTEEPQTTIRDVSLENKDLVGDFFQIGFSNECDNSYQLSFSRSDLAKLSRGELNVVTGTLEYFDVVDDEVSETIAVTCSK